MTGEVVLSAALRSNLLSLQKTQSSIDKVQSVLSTGLKVSSALDNPQNYFASQSLKNRSSDLTALLDGIGQSIQTIKTADAATTAISKLVDQADSLVASAREAVSSGQVQASITGNAKLAGISTITSVQGVAAGNTIGFTYYSKTGTLSTATVTVSSTDSIQQLIGKINDVGQGGYFEAKLNSDGYLSITETRGNSFNVNFNTDGSTALIAADLAFANALGFSSQVGGGTKNGATGTTTGDAGVTVLAKTKLESGLFYEAGSGNGFAENSDLLTSVVRTQDATAGATTSRFINASAGDALTLTFKVNGTKTSAAIDIQTLTIQGLVDAINTDTTVGGLIKASYDGTTGKFAIESLDATVSTVQLTVTDAVAAGASGPSVVDFDFGTRTALSPSTAAGDFDGENYLLASAASTLSRLQDDYNTVLTNITKLVGDSDYRGTNLLNGGSLTTFFNEERTNSLTTKGADLSAAGIGLKVADFSTSAKIEAIGKQILTAKDTLRNFGSTIANSLSIIQTREDFTKSLVSTLNEGADKLTVADQNESGAQLLALQTRQQLGVTALSLASQAQQSVLRLF